MEIGTILSKNFTPFSLSFPKQDEVQIEKIHYSKTCKKITSEDNIQYQLTLLMNEEKNQLIFHCAKAEELSLYFYYYSFDFNSLILINNAFKVFSSVEEIYSEISKLMQKSKVVIKNQENSENLDVLLKVQSFSGEEKEVKLTLLQKKINNLEITDEICKKYSFLQRKLKEVEKENETYVKRIEDLESKLEKTKKDWKESLDMQNISFNDSLTLYNKSIDTSIINKIEQVNFINQNLKKYCPYFANRSNFTYNLLYSAKKDGDEASKFHYYCDDKNCIICIIKSKTGKIFGGFSKIGWRVTKKEENLVCDGSAFLFNITDSKIYPLNKDFCNALGYFKDYGPIFHGNQKYENDVNFSILVNDKCLKKGGLICAKNESRYENFGNEEINDGKMKFEIEELECFQVNAEEKVVQIDED